MPNYLFVNQSDGTKVEAYFPVEDAPRIGDLVEIKDEVCRRIASFNLDVAGIARKTHQYPYVSKSLPRNLRGCETNQKGQPIIKSQAHERDVASEHDMAKE
tara:strand:+ start:8740 stop:9042 length:303 start_codon:yes stop_codon:yes gene_type:complete